MTARLTAAVVAGLLAVLQLLPAHAEGPGGGSDPECPNKLGLRTCGVATAGGFGVGGTSPSVGRAPTGGAGAHRPPALRRVDDGTRVETLLVPTCSGNTPGRTDVLCTPAVTGCPEPGQVRFWVYRRTITPASPDPAWQRVAAPPFVCVAPEEPGAPAFDPVAAIAASIEREFAQRAVLRAEAEISPSPLTLVNVPTRLRTDAPERYPIAFELFGLPVTIQVQAQRWSWVTGDGSIVVTTAPGTGGAVEHSYRRAGDLAPRVDITWSGSWSVAGSPEQQVPGTVTTQGVAAAVQVREARSELVGG